MWFGKCPEYRAGPGKRHGGETADTLAAQWNYEVRETRTEQHAVDTIPTGRWPNGRSELAGTGGACYRESPMSIDSDRHSFERARISLVRATDDAIRSYGNINLQSLLELAGRIGLASIRVCGMENSRLKRFLNSVQVPLLPPGEGYVSALLETEPTNPFRVGFMMQDLPMFSKGLLTSSPVRQENRCLSDWLATEAFVVIQVYGTKTVMDYLGVRYSSDKQKAVVSRPSSHQIRHLFLPSFHRITYADILRGVRNALGAHDGPPSSGPDVRRRGTLIGRLCHEGPFAIKVYICSVTIALGLRIRSAVLGEAPFEVDTHLETYPPNGDETSIPSGLALLSGSREFVWSNPPRRDRIVAVQPLPVGKHHWLNFKPRIVDPTIARLVGTQMFVSIRYGVSPTAVAILPVQIAADPLLLEWNQDKEEPRNPKRG